MTNEKISPEQIGPMIRFHRKKSGLSQKELAQMTGLGKTVVFDIEHGKSTIKMETLFKVFSVLNIEVQFQSPLMEIYQQESK